MVSIPSLESVKTLSWSFFRTVKKQKCRTKSNGQKAKLSDKKQKRTKTKLRTNLTVSDSVNLGFHDLL